MSIRTPLLQLVFATTALTRMAAAVGAPPADTAPMDRDAMIKLLTTVDDRQRNQGDWQSLVYMEQKEKDKVDVVYEARIYRRSDDNRFTILFTQPKSEQGKGYMRIDKNLWFYDPTVGKWERRTERERIGGTNSRRSDFDESRLAQEYEPSFQGYAKLGEFQTVRLKLKGKEGLDLAFPVIELWVDRANYHVLKRQEVALSGKLMRTSYYPKWQKLWSESKKGEIWYPQEIRFYDEVEKANSTHILIKSVDLRPLDKNLFTKAWLESKSR